MTLIDKVQALATDSGRLPLVYGTAWQINSELDRVARQGAFPICIMFQPSVGSFDIDTYGVNIRETITVNVGYACPIDFDYDPQAIKDTSETLKAESVSLIHRINASNVIEEVTNVNYELLPDSNDANLLICLLTLQIKEIDGRCE